MKAGELAQLLQAELSGGKDVEIRAVRGLSDISDGCLTFITSKKYLPEIAGSQASAVLVGTFYEELNDKVQLKVGNPYRAFARALELFYIKPEVSRGVMEGAVLEDGVSVGKDVTVYPASYLSAGSMIGGGTVIFPHVYIGKDTIIGSNCIIYSGVTIRENITVGNGVIIHPNAVIGADGYGFVFDDGVHHKIPQVGTVEIGDNVEIGAGVTIDRATTGVTAIGEGTKIDNLVQIAHNVKIGKHCLIVAQVGIGGSTTIEDYVTLGGQVGVADHTTIESGAMFAAKSGIMGHVKKGVYSGAPAIPHRQWLKAQVVYEKLPEMMKTLKMLEDKVNKLEVKEDD
jgi:UDP-3-O-[3-hydroxymyristoyl] glucosamine N-acyltransferase